MTQAKLLRRIGATRRGQSVALTCVLDDGSTITLIASEDQIDRLVDELEDVLHMPEESDTDDSA